MIQGYPADAIRAAEAPALAAGEPLMRRAARALADLVLDRAATHERPTVLVLVGGGNNGGDGLFAAADLALRARVVVALARADVHAEGLAAARDARVQVLDVSDGDESALAALVQAAEVADVWVDALAGIGVRGALRGPGAAVVDRLVAHLTARTEQPLVVAVDIPSGVDADTGAVPGPVLPATVTATFGGAKAGLLLPPGDRLAGEIVTVPLGLQPQLAAQRPTVSRLGREDARVKWPVPTPDAHKYTRGVVGVVAGSTAYPGAAVLTVGGALRTGCGMVRYLGPARPEQLVLQRWPEVVPGPGRVQAWVLGPGTGPDDDDRRDAIAAVLAEVDDDVAVVLDAGALTALPDRLPARTVLTPHAGELATLLSSRGEQVDRAEVEAEPRRWAARAAELTGATVLAKGRTTVVVAPDGQTYAQADGTGWLATAGAGDVLAGVLGALLAGLGERPVAEVAALAAMVHGRAAARAAGVGQPDPSRRGTVPAMGGPIVATDVVDALPATIRDLLGLDPAGDASSP